MTGSPHAARPFRTALAAPLLALALLMGGAQLVLAQTGSTAGDSTVVDAREAARKRDRSKLAAARAAMQAGSHPLLPWVEYWDLSSRLTDASVAEVEAFYQRWQGSYVEDRLRNDWLLELGRRRDFDNLARDYPRFRMNDDREVSCWALLVDHLGGRDVRNAGREAWFNQKETDTGCNMLATALVDGKRLSSQDVWQKARLSLEQRRPGAARLALGLLDKGVSAQAAEAIDNPQRFLRRSATQSARSQQELQLLAVMRLAADDPEAAAQHLMLDRSGLPPALAAWAWAYTGRQAAFKLSTDAGTYYLNALSLQRGELDWSDDTLSWGVRALLRNAAASSRWPAVLRLVGAMSTAELRDPAWPYWRAKALLASATPGTAGDAQRTEARAQFDAQASALNFYAKLAAEELGRTPALPPAPAALTAAEREAASTHPGLSRALLLVDLGLRDEARREWNFSLRGMDDRALLASARLACDRSDWQLCINTADRTKAEVDVSLRYPMPFAKEIGQAASAAGLEPAFVFGLIRQETRFMPQLRSSAGASGLMQVMPATGRWVARKIGLEGYRNEQLADPLINLQLGTSYLRLVLDDLSGSQAMAAAAYNAGPGRPRRWREGPVIDAAIWAENIPFNETRDYVKKVLSNTAVYSAMIDSRPALLRPRLGQTVGPREAGAAKTNTELP